MSEPNALRNLIVWADIPVIDLDRAAAFYAGVLHMKVSKESFGDMTFALFEHTDGNGGCLVIKPEEVSATGTLNYFNVDGRIKDALLMAEGLGGRILEPLHPIGTHGFRAVILDSEGNRLALHSSVNA